MHLVKLDCGWLVKKIQVCGLKTSCAKSSAHCKNFTFFAKLQICTNRYNLLLFPAEINTVGSKRQWLLLLFTQIIRAENRLKKAFLYNFFQNAMLRPQNSLVHNLLTNKCWCLHNQIYMYSFSGIVNLLDNSPGRYIIALAIQSQVNELKDF